MLGKKTVITMLKIQIVMYVVSVVLLAVLAGMLYRWSIAESAVSVSIMAIYVVTGMLGGLLSGKLYGRRRLLWGALAGVLYFLLLFWVSYGWNGGIEGEEVHFLTTFFLCVGGGAVGGILSSGRL